MGKRVNPQRVKSHLTLTPQEWAMRLDVNKNTILRWIKHEGLVAITDKKPYLIRGADLKAFLTSRKKKKRFDCKQGEMPCFACNKARRPAGNMLDYHTTTKTSGQLSALCEICLGSMNRHTRYADIKKLFPECSVTVTRSSETLCGSTDNRVNVHLPASQCVLATPIHINFKPKLQKEIKK